MDSADDLIELADDRTRRVFSPRLKIFVDVTAAAIGLVLLSPLMLIAAVLVKLSSRGPVLFGDEREGRKGRVFRCYKFRSMAEGAQDRQRELSAANPLDGRQFKLDHDPRVTRLGRFLRATNIDELPQLFNVVAGQMSLVGPRPSPFRENQVCVQWREARLSVRPGITGLWQVCRHDREAGDFHQWIHYDLLYVKHMTLWVDVKILLATLYTVMARTHVPVAWILRARVNPAARVARAFQESGAGSQATMMGVPIHNRLRMSTAVHLVLALAERAEPAQVSFVNAHCVNVAQRNAGYLDALRRSRLVLADGAGIRLAGRVLGFPVADNVNGTDFFPRLLEQLDGAAASIFLLGGAPGTAEKVAAWVADRHPGVKVAGVHHGYFGPDEEADVVKAIFQSGARILLVAMGVPQQELWIARRQRETGARVAIGVGGLFDFYSGGVRRAPAGLRRLGLEWTYRLCHEPRRLWRRYLIGNAVFLARLLREGVRLRAFKE